MIEPSRFSKFKYALLIGLILFIYFLDNLYFKSILGSTIIDYTLKPIFWLFVGILVWLFPAVRPKGKLKTQGSLYFWAFIFAFITIVLQVMAGLFDGLGKSPFDHSIAGILNNILTVAPVLIGRELSRHYLINSITQEENNGVFIIVAFFMTLLTFPIDKYLSFKSYEEVVIFMAKYFLPELSENLLATVLVHLGGPLTSITFMGTLEGFYWLSPILPNLKWITSALVGILTPVFLLTFVQGIYQDESHIRKRKEKGSSLGWIITTLISIGIVWFSVGVFPVYPSVIATGSMIPMIYPGDIIIVDKKIDTKELSKGEVIQFQRENILISHRIIDIFEKDGIKSYQTRGDNNSGPDVDLVKPEVIKGKIIKVIPKIGWPTLMLKRDKDIPLNEIEF